MSNGESPGDVIRAKDVGAFDVWGLPSFDPWQEEPETPEPEPVEELPADSEEVPLEEVQPLTLEELESIRQEAWNEGFATGEKEGFHSTQLKVRQEAEVALNAKVASQLDVLRQRLKDAGLSVTDLDCHQGTPPALGHTPLEQRWVDETA